MLFFFIHCKRDLTNIPCAMFLFTRQSSSLLFVLFLGRGGNVRPHISATDIHPLLHQCVIVITVWTAADQNDPESLTAGQVIALPGGGVRCAVVPAWHSIILWVTLVWFRGSCSLVAHKLFTILTIGKGLLTQ